MTTPLEFRDPVRARELTDALDRTLERIGRTVSVMHVCGSHEQAIARFDRRELLLPPPTYTSIRQLAPRTSIDDVLGWLQDRRIARVMPGFFDDGGIATLTLPGDPLFPTIPDWEVPEETRFVLQDGARWQPSKA